VTEPAAPRVRKDVARNREQLLRAAASAFATEGFAVAAETIASEAGVSVATLYRHFPDRESLVAEVHARVNDEWNTLLGDACARDDAWTGLVWFLEQLGERAAARPAFADLARMLVTRGYPGSVRWNTAWGGLIDRLEERGDLGDGVTGADVAVMTISYVMAVSTFEQVGPGMRHRHLDLVLGAIASDARRRRGLRA